MKKAKTGKAVLAMLLCAACCAGIGCQGGKAPADESKGSTVEESTVEGSKVEESTVESASSSLPALPTERVIHAISELNTAEYPLDSAAGEEQYSTLMENWRESYVLEKTALGSIDAYYPRIKKLQNGKYLMVFHNGEKGQNVYCSMSDDCIQWSTPVKLFTTKQVPLYGGQDWRLYMTPDAYQLENGRIIVVCSYRSTQLWTSLEGGGLAIRCSDDNGETWSEERIVYVGANWEPTLLQVESGEIYLYFTAIAPSLYQYGERNIGNRSSGIGMIRSTDNGESWTPDVKGAPYRPQYVMRQFAYNNGQVDRYTDQMPTAIQLNNGTVILGAESYFENVKKWNFSISYNNDGYAEDVGMDKTGPADRQNNLFPCAGPYLAQFPSGEVVLTFGGTYRLGDCTAHTFYDRIRVFPEDTLGQWGSVERTSSHSVVTSIGTKDYRIEVARLYLNHRLNAKKMTPSLIADTSEWDGNTDALFCGSKSQAQVSVRVGYDDDNIYLLAERLDRQITSDDGMIFYLSDGSADGFYRVTVGNEGITEFVYKSENAAQGEPVDFVASGVKTAVYVDGTVNDRAKIDNGVIYELAIPKTLLKEEGRLQLIFDLVNSDREGDKPVTDMSNPEANFRKKENWFVAAFA